MKLLVTGANGQLGYALKKLSGDFENIEFVFCDRSMMDLTSDESIVSAMNNHQPDVVINAAAYTNVDKAEEERELAMRVNAGAVGVLARECEDIGARLLTVSTDYVFGGGLAEPYPVNHPPNPVNYYGQTKLEGERLAKAECSRTIVVRTQWLYGRYGHNFANTMRRLFQEREELSVVSDQIGRPTKSSDLAAYCMSLILSSVESGVFHFGGSEIMSWHEFAMSLLREENGDTVTRVIHAVPSSEYPTQAVRPKYSVLELSSGI